MLGLGGECLFPVLAAVLGRREQHLVLLADTHLSAVIDVYLVRNLVDLLVDSLGLLGSLLENRNLSQVEI